MRLELFHHASLVDFFPISTYFCYCIKAFDFPIGPWQQTAWRRPLQATGSKGCKGMNGSVDYSQLLLHRGALLLLLMFWPASTHYLSFASSFSHAVGNKWFCV